MEEQAKPAWRRVAELRAARLFLEHSYARLGAFVEDMADRDAKAIIRWAIFDVDNDAAHAAGIIGGTQEGRPRLPQEVA